MENSANTTVRKTFSIILLSALFIASGSAAIRGQSRESISSFLSNAKGTIEYLTNPSDQQKYASFDLQNYPLLSDFVNRYDSLGDLLSHMDSDYGLSYDLSGDQNYYRQMSYNESPLALLTKVADKNDNTYQCFERAELVALWAEEKFGYPPLILDYFTSDPNNIQMNHSTYVYEVNGKWGYMSDTSEYTKPIYDSVEELAADWMAHHGAQDDPGKSYVRWLLIDLRKLYRSQIDWRTTNQNIKLYMWDVINSGTAIY